MEDRPWISLEWRWTLKGRSCLSGLDTTGCAFTHIHKHERENCLSIHSLSGKMCQRELEMKKRWGKERQGVPEWDCVCVCVWAGRRQSSSSSVCRDIQSGAAEPVRPHPYWNPESVFVCERARAVGCRSFLWLVRSCELLIIDQLLIGFGVCYSSCWMARGARSCNIQRARACRMINSGEHAGRFQLERHKGTDYVTSPVEGIPKSQSRHCDFPQHLKAPLLFLMSSEVMEDRHLQRRTAQLTLRCEWAQQTQADWGSVCSIFYGSEFVKELQD